MDPQLGRAVRTVIHRMFLNYLIGSAGFNPAATSSTFRETMRNESFVSIQDQTDRAHRNDRLSL
jgi:hypothetical protein